MSAKKEEMVPLSEAENEVKVVTHRLALLHLAYGRTLVDEFGWERGKQLILDAIKEYGRRVAHRTKEGHQSLPRYGFWERREGAPHVCELGKIVLEYDEMDIGSLYCLIDSAKAMFANHEEKMVHTKAITVGDDHCAFENLPTTEKDREDFFGKSRDWSHVDPRLDEYYRKIS
ncbi:MAG: hypothetical protein JSV18_04035 [Candidatus Bathyarchaeota archaeon]|nr:MAG: hypothetical protein JSV18_04035 [Candidatus Bathyarchaeota archaeon]